MEWKQQGMDNLWSIKEAGGKVENISETFDLKLMVIYVNMTKIISETTFKTQICLPANFRAQFMDDSLW